MACGIWLVRSSVGSSQYWPEPLCLFFHVYMRGRVSVTYSGGERSASRSPRQSQVLYNHQNVKGGKGLQTQAKQLSKAAYAGAGPFEGKKRFSEKNNSAGKHTKMKSTTKS